MTQEPETSGGRAASDDDAGVTEPVARQGSSAKSSEQRFVGWLGAHDAELFTAYVVLAIAVLIALRVAVDGLAFLGVGWIIALALLPLLPWLLPRLGGFLRDISPYVQGFSLAGFQLQLRSVQQAPLALPTQTALVALPNDESAFSSSTGITDVVARLRELAGVGGSPVAIIDLQTGNKWRLPNLYFLCLLLEVEPIVSQLVFTEMRGGVDGYVVLTCRPPELRRRIEREHPEYRTASVAQALDAKLASGHIVDQAFTQQLGTAFQNLRTTLNTMNVAALVDYVSASTLSDLMGGPSLVTVDATTATLTEAELRAVLGSADRYVPSTKDDRLVGVIDREAVALALARTAIAATPIGRRDRPA